MGTNKQSSKSFLSSLTGSLILHLIVLIVMLLPNGDPYSEENPPVENGGANYFQPSLLINYSDSRFNSALSFLSAHGKKVPRDRTSWRQANINSSLKRTLEETDIEVDSVSLVEGQLNKRIYSIKSTIYSTPQNLLRDSLFMGYAIGIATKRSNFSSDNALLVFTEKEGKVVNVKFSTSDARLFTAQQISPAQFIQRWEVY